MRYALTYTQGGFERTNTTIVDVDADEAESYNFGDNPKDIEEALIFGAGLSRLDASEIVRDKSYYLNKVDDIDAYIKR